MRNYQNMALRPSVSLGIDSGTEVGDLESFKYSLSQDDIKYLDTLKPDLHVLV